MKLWQLQAVVVLSYAVLITLLMLSPLLYDALAVETSCRQTHQRPAAIDHCKQLYRGAPP